MAIVIKIALGWYLGKFLYDSSVLYNLSDSIRNAKMDSLNRWLKEKNIDPRKMMKNGKESPRVSIYSKTEIGFNAKKEDD